MEKIISYIKNIKTDTLIYTNILIFLFNMLPIYPLDGGRILKNALHVLIGRVSSMKITIIISKMVAIALSALCIYISIVFKNYTYIFILIYIWIIVIKSSKILNIKIKMYKILKNNIAIN